MNFGRSLRPLYLAAAGFALAAAVACGGSAAPSSTVTPVPTLEATVEATAAPAFTPTMVPIVTPSATYTPVPTAVPPPTVTPPPTPPPSPIPTPPPTVTPRPPTPTPTPIPPTPTPRPNPAVVRATKLHLDQDVVSGLSVLGSDYFLDYFEEAFIDAVAANPLEVQLAMVKSPYLTNNKLALTDLVAAAATLQNYHPKLREAVWATPDKSIQLSSGSFNPSSMLELIVKGDVKAVKVLDYMQSRVFDNPAFWEAFGSDELVQDKDDVGKVVKETWVRWDAKKWPVRNWQAVMAMMQVYDPFSYFEDDLDKVIDEVGVFPGQCVYCYGKSWDLLEPKEPNGSLAYFNLVNSEGNIVREWLKAITHHVWADGEGLLVRPYRANNAERLRQHYGRDPIVNSSAETSQSSRNVIFMSQTKLPGGTFLSPFTWALDRVGGTKDERLAVQRIVEWYLSNVTHQTGEKDKSPAYSNARDYKGVSPQNPVIPPAEAITIVKKTSSGLNTTSITAFLRSLGIPAEGVIEGDNGNVVGLVVVNGQRWYYEGDTIFNAGLRGTTSCNLLGTYEQVNTLPHRRGDGSFCR